VISSTIARARATTAGSRAVDAAVPSASRASGSPGSEERAVGGVGPVRGQAQQVGDHASGQDAGRVGDVDGRPGGEVGGERGVGPALGTLHQGPRGVLGEQVPGAGADLGVRRPAEEPTHLLPEQLRPEVADAALAVHAEGGVVVEDLPREDGVGHHPPEPRHAGDGAGVARRLQEGEQAGVRRPQQPGLVPRRSFGLHAGHPPILAVPEYGRKRDTPQTGLSGCTQAEPGTTPGSGCVGFL
jgi:hypothetical protein